MIDKFVVGRQIENLKMTHPELWEDDDDDFLAQVLEGETDLHRLLSTLVDQIHLDESVVAGLSLLLSTYKTRRDRYERRVEALRNLAFQMMQMADVNKLVLPQATLGVRIGPSRVVIADEAAIPDAYWRVARTPNKALIKEHIQQGIDVPGTSLSNAVPVISIHTK